MMHSTLVCIGENHCWWSEQLSLHHTCKDSQHWHGHACASFRRIFALAEAPGQGRQDRLSHEVFAWLKVTVFKVFCPKEAFTEESESCCQQHAAQAVGEHLEERTLLSKAFTTHAGMDPPTDLRHDGTPMQAAPQSLAWAHCAGDMLGARADNAERSQQIHGNRFGRLCGVPFLPDSFTTQAAAAQPDHGAHAFLERCVQGSRASL